MTASNRSDHLSRPSAASGSPITPIMPAAVAAAATSPPVPGRPARMLGPGRRRLGLSLLALLAIGAGGCRAQERSFPGESPTNVWSAARAAAEAPDYMPEDLENRWIVDVNEVQVDEEAGEMEIFRELSRLHLRSGGDRFVERRTWKIGVDVVEDDGDPTVRMVSRGLAVPAHVTAEADRYFDQIAELLRPPAMGDALPADMPESDADSEADSDADSEADSDADSEHARP